MAKRLATAADLGQATRMGLWAAKRAVGEGMVEVKTAILMESGQATETVSSGAVATALVKAAGQAMDMLNEEGAPMNDHCIDFGNGTCDGVGEGDGRGRGRGDCDVFDGGGHGHGRCDGHAQGEDDDDAQGSGSGLGNGVGDGVGSGVSISFIGSGYEPNL